MDSSNRISEDLTFRPWIRYDVEVRSIRYGFREEPCFVELGDPFVMEVDKLGAELYNDALAKTDSTDVDSVYSFVSEFGIPTSPLYDGHQRLMLFRYRDSKGAPSYKPASEMAELDRSSDYRYADLVASFGIPDAYERGLGAKGNASSVLVPGLVSEMARSEELSNHSTRGAVSFLEVSQTIRLLQTSMPLVAAYQALSESGDPGDIEGVYRYVHDRRFVPERGNRYFLREVDDNRPFDDQCAQDKGFAAAAERFRSEGGNPKAAWQFSEIQAVRNAAKNALTFLTNAYEVSKAPVEPSAESVHGLMRHFDFEFFANLSERSRSATMQELNGYGSLTEAIIWQYLSLLYAKTPWQKCENCGRYFKRAKGADPRRSLRKTRFCSRSCNVSFNEKKKRVADKS